MDDIIKDFHDLTEIPPFQQMIPDKSIWIQKNIWMYCR